MFAHKDAAWSRPVIDASHSQKKESLVDLADNYVLGTYGGISAVVVTTLAKVKGTTFIL